MSDEIELASKNVHADDLKYVKAYIDKKRDIYEAATDEYVDETLTQMQTDVNEFKSQIENDNDEFKTQIETNNNEYKTQVESRLDELAISAGGAKVFDLNLELIPGYTRYNQTSSSYNSEVIFNSNNFEYVRESSDIENEHVDAIINQIKARKQCVAVINYKGDERVYIGCETEYQSNTGIIRIYNAGLKITFGYSVINGVSKPCIKAYQFDVKNANQSVDANIYAPDYSYPLAITRLEFRGV